MLQILLLLIAQILPDAVWGDRLLLLRRIALIRRVAHKDANMLSGR